MKSRVVTFCLFFSKVSLAVTFPATGRACWGLRFSASLTLFTVYILHVNHQLQMITIGNSVIIKSIQKS